jgi:hypothetical protein
VADRVTLGDGGSRHVETLRALVAAGPSTRLTDRQGATPLALAKEGGYGEMVKKCCLSAAPA